MKSKKLVVTDGCIWHLSPNLFFRGLCNCGSDAKQLTGLVTFLNVLEKKRQKVPLFRSFQHRIRLFYTSKEVSY